MMMRFVCLILVLSMLGCEDKVPIQIHQGQFEFVSAHWFENEKTEYVFFSVKGLRPGLTDSNGPARFEISTRGDDHYAELNFAAAVHRHHLVTCGPDKLCGSYSFHAVTPVNRLRLRFRYYAGAPMTEAINVGVATHPAGPSGDAQSALVFGVFNADNTAVHVQIHDNFGSPDSSQIKQFGMERKFEIVAAQLADLTVDQEAKIATTSGTAFLYPASECAQTLANSESGKNAQKISDEGAWLPTRFPLGDARAVACFTARALDNSAKVLNEQPGLARKNPELVDQSLQIRPPVGEAHSIPLILTYCSAGPGESDYVSPVFLSYQAYVMGVPYTKPDLCFAKGFENDFARGLDVVLNQKLSAARAANAGKSQDYFFNVVINERLSTQIIAFHRIISSHLSALIAAEVGRPSPRLVGAFVYDSQSPESRGLSDNRKIIWCPQRDSINYPNDERQADRNANCTPQLPAGKFNFGPINFKIPIGPFPTMTAYEDYVANFADDGKSKNPHLVIRTVQTNLNSSTSRNGNFYTFFDGERISLNAGERLKLCRERDGENLLGQLVFNVTSAKNAGQIVGADGVQNFTNGSVDTPTLHVGLNWDAPFIGEFSYSMPVVGQIFGVIPFSKTARPTRGLGDPRWQKSTWDVGPVVQKCQRFCSHPFFDEGGTYLIEHNWMSAGQCANSKIAEPQ